MIPAQYCSLLEFQTAQLNENCIKICADFTICTNHDADNSNSSVATCVKTFKENVDVLRKQIETLLTSCRFDRVKKFLAFAKKLKLLGISLL